MSASSRRPPSDDGTGDAPVPVGYLRDERLPDDAAAGIALRLDEALRSRVAARRRLRLAAALALTAAAAAVLVGLLVARGPVPVAPAPGAPAPEIDRTPPAAPVEPAPTPPRTESRGVRRAPAAPSRPTEEPPLAEEREPRQEPPPAPASGPEKSGPAVAGVPGPALPREVAPAGGPDRVAQLFLRRTDDPRRPPIVMTIRYRRPEQGASKEVPR